MELSLLLLQSLLAMTVMAVFGVICMKIGVIKAPDAGPIAVIALYVAFPCAMITSCEADLNMDTLKGLGVALVACILVNVLFVAVSALLGRLFHLDAPERLSMIYTNSANLIIPLVTALLGKEYLIYTTPFLIVQVIMYWTHCVHVINPDIPFTPKRILANPCVLSLVVGIFVYFTGFRFPGFIESAMNSSGVCVALLSMFGIGILVYQADWKTILVSPRYYGVVFARLVLLPMMFVLLVAATGITRSTQYLHDALLITTLAAAAPTGVTISQMCTMFGGDSVKAGSINVLSDVFALITMPLIVMLYQTIC